MLYSQTRQQVVRQDWRERKPAGAGGGESSLPEWGRTKDGNQEEKEKEVTGGGIGKIGTKTSPDVCQGTSYFRLSFMTLFFQLANVGESAPVIYTQARN